ncbi:immunoglobulin-like domain-containing protein [Mariniflexile maritimum]|uniref:immunoglobulin-like domain-containing protein n=1 Tax=Mariniflexile maritimum TaxID=2682493 RepID=UPI0012F64946|nr:immunoglobulin-like domain-containing protein [Mariniflexile maritimum]
MKITYKYISRLSILLIAFLMMSCTEENPIESAITNFPTFEYNSMVVISLGSNFTPVVKATENGVELPVTKTGSVDINTVGVYTMTYTATNSDGFDGSVSQTVIVHNPLIIGTDVSGDIVDANNSTRTGVITLVKGTTSIFYVTDFAFSGAFPMYFQMNGNTISEIKQVYPLGQTSVDLTYDPVTKRFTTKVNPAGFSYTFKYK